MKDPKKKEAMYNLVMKTKNDRIQFIEFYEFIEENWGATVDDTVQE